MELADKVVVDATSVTEADWDRLRALGLDDAQIMDVVLAAAVRCFLSKTLDALGVQPDASFRELDPAFRDAMTVGRPIATV
jgi:alkylhydroperoxidase family enzyme